jgi:DNA-binding winged helix-turn-helix (wHTH) protein
MPEQKKRFYDFGPYRLDPIKRVLLKDGAPVQLTPKAFDTLLVLVEERGHLLAKEELINRVWQASFVEEGNLTVTISMLRKALGENRGEHRYIVTAEAKG